MNDKINDLTLIAVTAGLTEDNMKKCKTHGFDNILIKPIMRD